MMNGYATSALTMPIGSNHRRRPSTEGDSASGLYPITQTSQAYGLEGTVKDSTGATRTLRAALSGINAIAKECETTTENSCASLRVAGSYGRIRADGHLALNPGKVDLRIIPGTVDALRINKGPAPGRYHASLLSDGQVVHVASFAVDETMKPPQFEGHFPLRPIVVRPFRSKTESVETLWRKMTDVHHFYSLLKEKGIERLDAFNSVPDELAVRVGNDAARHVLDKLQDADKAFTAFIGNDAVVQIYTGKIERLVTLERHEKIVLHGKTSDGQPVALRLSEPAIAQAWVVNKPSRHGWITSLELFDQSGKCIAQFFDARDEEQPQSPHWKALLGALPRATGEEDVPAAAPTPFLSQLGEFWSNLAESPIRQEL